MQNWLETIIKLYTQLTISDMILLVALVVGVSVSIGTVYIFIRNMREEAKLIRRLVSEAEPHVDLSGSMLDVMRRYG